MNSRFFLVAVTLLCAALFAGACGEDDPAGECSNSSTCAVGEVCREGACEERPCQSGANCELGEACYQPDTSGFYSAGAIGSCTFQECDEARGGCGAGEVCVGGACYLDPVTPQCTVAGDCAAGQICTNGVCQADPALCTPACGANQTCNNGTCVDDNVGGCNPPCGAGQECQFEVCVDVSGGCNPACGANQTCENNVCVNNSGGCNDTPCTGGRICDSGSGECMDPAGLCSDCTGDAICGTGAGCVLVGETTKCLPLCEGGASCFSGTCTDVGGRMACVPVDQCAQGGGGCELTAADCSGATPYVDAADCDCVACLGDSNCANGFVCNSTNQCIPGTTGGDECFSAADCQDPNRPMCLNGVCACFSNNDCPAGAVCVGNQYCQACNCAAGLICDSQANCIDPTICAGNADCAASATALGADATVASTALCDSGGIGCYIPGTCNADGGIGGIPIPIPGLGDGGSADPFNAPCGGSTVCTSDFTGIFLELLGLGSGGAACSGCTTDADCRPGESCQANFLDPTVSACSAASGGGGFGF